METQQEKEPQHGQRLLNSIDIFTWLNHLKRFQFLLERNKMTWQCEDELYTLVKKIDAEKDNAYISLDVLKKTQLGKIMKSLSKCEAIEVRSRKVGRRVYKYWLGMCREVEQ